jgi:hypothetical protein
MGVDVLSQCRPLCADIGEIEEFVPTEKAVDKETSYQDQDN